MKTTKLPITLALGLCMSAQAGVFTYNSGTIDALIPDANLTGWSSSVSMSGLPNQLTDVSINLNISGGFNGDLYAYLSFDGKLLPLLNRVGVGTGSSAGSSTSGMNITLSDGYANVHDATSVSSPLTGTYSPDGRAISPLSSASSFDAVNFQSPNNLVTFSDFSGKDPNGTWTLFFADVSGGSTSTLVSWDLNVTAVPEPVNVAMLIFGGLFGAGLLWRRVSKA